MSAILSMKNVTDFVLNSAELRSDWGWTQEEELDRRTTLALLSFVQRPCLQSITLGGVICYYGIIIAASGLKTLTLCLSAFCWNDDIGSA